MLSICVEISELEILSEFKINNLHKLGANLYSKLPVAPFSCKKVGHWKDGWKEGWMDGWKDGKAG